MESNIIYEEFDNIEDYINVDLKENLAKGWTIRYCMEVTNYSSCSFWLISWAIPLGTGGK